MTFTPGTNRPTGNRSQSAWADGFRQEMSESLKEAHLRSLRQPDASARIQNISNKSTGPLYRRFEIATFSSDGKTSYAEHRAPAELFLEDICARFARGTLIASDNGHTAVEDLQPGDLVRTRDNGLQPLRWISSCTLVNPVADADADLPLRIKADALGELRPTQDLIVSSQFRLLTTHPSCETLFGTTEALAPASDLVDGETVLTLRASPDLRFYNLMLSDHHIIEANGLATETYHPGSFGVAIMSLEMQSHMRMLFPHLNGDLNLFGRPARPVMKGYEAEALRVG